MLRRASRSSRRAPRRALPALCGALLLLVSACNGETAPLGPRPDGGSGAELGLRDGHLGGELGARDGGPVPEAGCPAPGPGSVPPGPASSAMSPTDVAALTSALEKLAAAWDQPSVDAANSILMNAAYTADDFRWFLDQHLASHPFTRGLWDYIGYPTYYWAEEPQRIKLQRALTSAVQARFDALLQQHAPSFGTTLASDAGLRQTLFVGHFPLVASFGKESLLGATERTAIRDWNARIVRSYPALLQHTARIDPAAQPYVPALRAQISILLLDSSSDDACGREAVVAALGLSGARAQLLRERRILLHDNLSFSARQLEVVVATVAAIPRQLTLPHHITQAELLGNVDPTRVDLALSTGVNIFPFEVGERAENSFPPDATAAETDTFLIALVHELNHVVNAQYIEAHPRLGARQKALVTQAGTNDLSYVRSFAGAGAFFQGAPQEFFASLSNAWFTSSANTFELAFARFNQGHHEPLHQALFIADVYSVDGATTRFYTADKAGNLVAEDVAVTRNAAGFISGYARGGVTVSFVLDAANNVVSFSKP